MANKLIKTIDYNDEFNPDIQKHFIDYLMSDHTAFSLCRNILSDEYFDAQLSSTVQFMIDYAENHRSVPPFELVKAKTGIPVRAVGFDDNQRNYILTEIEKFCQYKALQNAIMKGAQLLEEGQGGEIQRLVQQAMEISLQTDLGTDYFENPKGRLEYMRDNASFISTGWAVLDDKLGGGFAPGTLNIFCGGSGSGKSLFLQNIALNWVETGKNVIYISLELAEDLISLRFDAMVSKRGTKAVFKDIDETAFEIISAGRNAGKLIIKRMKEGTNCNDIRAFIKEYEIKTGIKPDCVVLDYLDLLHPNNKKIDVSNLFVKDKYTSEEFRGFLEEFQYLSATASQLNRGSVEVEDGDFNQAHIAGGISKLNTADNAFAIHTNLAMKEDGVYRIIVLKGRTSDAVNQKVEFGYNNRTMRITDPVQDDVEKPTSKANLKKEMKVQKKPTLIEEEPEPPKSEGVLDIMERLKEKKKKLDV